MREQLRQLILKVLLAHGEALAESVLRAGMHRALAAAITEADITLQLEWCEQQKLIIGAADGLVGTMWGLTAEGKLRAAQLR